MLSVPVYIFTGAPFTGKYCNVRTKNFAIIPIENNDRKELLENIPKLSKDKPRDQFSIKKLTKGRKYVGGEQRKKKKHVETTFNFELNVVHTS